MSLKIGIIKRTCLKVMDKHTLMTRLDQIALIRRFLKMHYHINISEEAVERRINLYESL